MIIALPVVPAGSAEVVIAVNEDVGETIGWPELATTVADVYRELPDRERAVILADNYGQAGAIDRFGPALGLPRAYSGHNAYGDWGPPSSPPGPVIAIGQVGEQAFLRDCTVAARIDNEAGIENSEYGSPVFVCVGPRSSWSEVWPALRHLG